MTPEEFNDHLKMIKKKKHNRLLVYNNHANCINIFNLNRPRQLSYRIDLTTDQFQIVDGYVGFSFNQLKKSDLSKYYQEFVDSWKE